MKTFDAKGICIVATAYVLFCKDSHSMSLWEEMIANCNLTVHKFTCVNYNISDTAQIPGFPDSAIGSAVLNLGSNQITSLKAGLFDSLSSLQELYLYSNQIANLSIGLFDTLVYLKVLDLKENLLTTLETGLFNSLSRLKTLRLDSNLITSLGTGLFDAMSALTVLQLDYNRIEVIEPGLFNNLANLQILYLTENRVKTLTSGIFESLSNLQVLVLQGNPIQSISTGFVSLLKSITWLYLPIVCDCIESKSLSSLNNAALAIIGESNVLVTEKWKSATAGCNGTWVELPYCEQFMTTGTEGVAPNVPITSEMSTSVLATRKAATLTSTTDGMIYTVIAAIAGSIASAVIILNVSSKIFKAIEIIKTQTVTSEQIEDTVVDIVTPEYEFSWKPAYAGCQNIPPICHEGIIFRSDLCETNNFSTGIQCKPQLFK